MELVQLHSVRRQLEQRNIRLVAVSVDPPEGAAKMRSVVGVRDDDEMLFLSDADGRLLDLLGVRHRGANPETGGDIAQSASFLIGPDGTVLWQHLAANYRVRPQPSEILAAYDDLPR